MQVEPTEPAEETSEASASEETRRELRCDRQAREYVQRYGPCAARDEAYWADHRNETLMAEALLRAAERLDGGESTWAF